MDIVLKKKTMFSNKNISGEKIGRSTPTVGTCLLSRKKKRVKGFSYSSKKPSFSKTNRVECLLKSALLVRVPPMST